MISTRWIAVVILLASPAAAQSLKFEQTAREEEVELLPSPAVQLPNEPSSFDEELEKLQREVAAIKTLRERISEEASRPLGIDSLKVQEQRQELFDLLTKLATRKPSPPPAAAPIVSAPVQPLDPIVEPKPEPKTLGNPSSKTGHPLITDKIVDPYALGRALFRAGDFSGAEQAFRRTTVTDENRIMLQYLIATCLRKQSQWEQAAKAYRIVSENKEDPALRDLALWQMENIRWHQQTATQLEQLRDLRSSSNKPQSNSATNGAGTN